MCVGGVVKVVFFFFLICFFFFCDQKARVSRTFVREGEKKISLVLLLYFIPLNLRGTFQSFTQTWP